MLREEVQHPLDLARALDHELIAAAAQLKEQKLRDAPAWWSRIVELLHGEFARDLSIAEVAAEAAAGQEPTIARHRIIERSRERMLRREPIIDRQHRGARCRAHTPRQMPVERRRTGDIHASMEE